MAVDSDLTNFQSLRLLRSLETQTKRLIQSSNDLEAALGANPSARNLAPLMRSITSGIKGMDRMVQLSEFLILEDPKENKKPFDFDLLCMTLYELLNSELITKSIAMEFQVQGDGVIQVQPGMFSKLVYYHLVDLIECINHTDEPKIKLELVSKGDQLKIVFSDNRKFPNSVQTDPLKIQYLNENVSAFAKDISVLSRGLNATHMVKTSGEWVINEITIDS